MALLMVGLNHKTAPVAVRERRALADQTQAEPLARWHDPAVEEVVILSTCNRVECYIQGPDAAAGVRCRPSHPSVRSTIQHHGLTTNPWTRGVGLMISTRQA